MGAGLSFTIRTSRTAGRWRGGGHRGFIRRAVIRAVGAGGDMIARPAFHHVCRARARRRRSWRGARRFTAGGQCECCGGGEYQTATHDYTFGIRPERPDAQAQFSWPAWRRYPSMGLNAKLCHIPVDVCALSHRGGSACGRSPAVRAAVSASSHAERNRCRLASRHHASAASAGACSTVRVTVSKHSRARCNTPPRS